MNEHHLVLSREQVARHLRNPAPPVFQRASSSRAWVVGRLGKDGEAGMLEGEGGWGKVAEKEAPSPQRRCRPASLLCFSPDPDWGPLFPNARSACVHVQMRSKLSPSWPHERLSRVPRYFASAAGVRLFVAPAGFLFFFFFYLFVLALSAVPRQLRRQNDE